MAPREMTAAATEVRATPTAPGARRDRRRLLMVVNELPFLLSHRLPVLEGAKAAGYDVHVAVPRASGDVGVLERSGFVVHDIPLDRRGMNPVAEGALLAALARLYRRLRPDVVHHVTVKPVLYGSLAARAAAVPRVVNAVSGLGYVQLARGWRGALLRGAVRAAYRLGFGAPQVRVVFQNEDDRDAFVGAGVVRVAQTVVVPGGSGVDLARFAPSPEPAGSPVVLLAARMLWDKGVGEFVDAARLLRARGVSARFVLVGDTDANRAAVPADTLRTWASEGTVEWWGRRDDMPRVLAAASIVVLPSYREGCPKVLLEAAACARAIVTTDVPGCREVVREGEHGTLVPARDAAALAAAIAGLLADPPRRARMGRAARERAEREFDVRQVVRRTLAEYDAPASPPRGAARAAGGER